MIIKKLVLNNIRSYSNESIVFPTGSVLLSGDIGSGKSSILLSIEFVLFGFRRNDLSGSTLLRHGEKEGSVELHFDVNGKDIIIKRFLKRLSTSIKQDNGFIVIDGVKQDMAAVELKSKVLELLGYPMDLLSKSKESIYRYTVYTPQEEMKHIIFADTQERLDILRRVFGIDKYKRIKENLVIYSRELKKKISYFQGQTDDLDSIKKERNDVDKNLLLSKDSSKIVFSKEKELKENLDKISEDIKKYDVLVKEMDSKINVVKILSRDINQSENIIKDSKENIVFIEKRLVDENKSLDKFKGIDSEKLKVFLTEVNSKINDLLEKKSNINQSIAIIKSKNEESSLISSKIISIDNCPTCKQIVSVDHKESIKKDAEKILVENSLKKEKLDEILLKVDNNLKILNSKKEDVSKKISEMNTFELIKKSVQEKEKDIIILKEKILVEEKKSIDLKKDIEKNQDSIILLEKNIMDFKDVKKDYDELNINYQNSLKESSALRQKVKSFEEQLALIDKRINMKKSLLKKMSRLNSIYSILDDSGLVLVGLMEKIVLGSIHYEFNEFISKWFNLLIDEDMLSLRIDSEFNPIVSQNGYETSIDNLSGGEKTAVALSYRLALNRIINDMVSSIMTKDLLILDEPTEGFSSEELDKLNDVLAELGAKQLIIVSHDSKIEGFVENHIRVEKSGHESKVI